MYLKYPRSPGKRLRSMDALLLDARGVQLVSLAKRLDFYVFWKVPPKGKGEIVCVTRGEG